MNIYLICKSRGIRVTYDLATKATVLADSMVWEEKCLEM